MSRKRKALVCVAHPDDEVIFFGGLLAMHAYDWTVVVVTDADADGKGADRRRRFKKSCALLGVNKTIELNFPDRYDKRLRVGQLIKELDKLDSFKLVFTHGILGDYGHIHHQDVCYAVHQSFQGRAKIYSAASNIYPDLHLRLTRKAFELKTKIYWRIYQEETREFLNFLPVTSSEGFAKISLMEVKKIYQFLVTGQKWKGQLQKYAWLQEYLLQTKFRLASRPF